MTSSKLARLLDRQIPWLGALQDLVYEVRSTAKVLRKVHPVRHEASGVHEPPPFIDCRHPVPCRKLDSASAVGHRDGVGQDEKRFGPISSHRGQDGMEIVGALRRYTLKSHSQLRR